MRGSHRARAADWARPHGRALGRTTVPHSPRAAASEGKESGATTTVEAATAEPAHQARQHPRMARQSRRRG
eukprot:2155533-Prymnesium_polylepis.1